MLMLAMFAVVATLAVFRIARIGARLRASSNYVALELRLGEIESYQENIRFLLSGHGELMLARQGRPPQLGDAIRMAERVGRADLLARLRAVEFEVKTDEGYFIAADAGSREAREKLDKRESRLFHDIRNLKFDVAQLRAETAADVERDGARMLYGALALAVLLTIV